MNKRIIIDATEAMMGRIASFAAKQSLLGKEIIIVNCNDALITGKRKSILGEYQRTRARGGSSLKGPHFPKAPERIMKRTVRGMLSYRQARGSEALKRIICYNAVPNKYEKEKKLSLKRPVKIKALKLSSLSADL